MTIEVYESGDGTITLLTKFYSWSSLEYDDSGVGVQAMIDAMHGELDTDLAYDVFDEQWTATDCAEQLTTRHEAELVALLDTNESEKNIRIELFPYRMGRSARAFFACNTEGASNV